MAVSYDNVDQKTWFLVARKLEFGIALIPKKSIFGSLKELN